MRQRGGVMVLSRLKYSISEMQTTYCSCKTCFMLGSCIISTKNLGFKSELGDALKSCTISLGEELDMTDSVHYLFRYISPGFRTTHEVPSCIRNARFAFACLWYLWLRRAIWLSVEVLINTTARRQPCIAHRRNVTVAVRDTELLVP